METKAFSSYVLICATMIIMSVSAHSESRSSTINEKFVTYQDNGITLKGFIAYDESIKGKRPVVLVIHEWWGLNDYIEMRARQLAALGYLAMAVDMFGDGKNAANPTEAQGLTMPYYKDPKLVKSRLDAAINKIKEYPQADPNNLAAIGYCFGGYVVLNYAKLGADLKCMVSFHGGLGGVPVNKKMLKAKILICQGASDKFVSPKDAVAFKQKLDSIGADCTLKIYANATHAFTNPAATKLGKEFNLPIEYNAAADKDSWNDMEVFFIRIFNK